MRFSFSSMPRSERFRCGFLGSDCVLVLRCLAEGGGSFLGCFFDFGAIGFGTPDAWIQKAPVRR